jgi:hypothetical protein
MSEARTTIAAIRIEERRERSTLRIHAARSVTDRPLEDLNKRRKTAKLFTVRHEVLCRKTHYRHRPFRALLI